MKKIVSIMFCLFFVCIMSIPCFTAENDGNTSCDVKGKYVSQIKSKFKAEVKDGKAEVTLPDGTIIQVEGVTKDGLWLVIVPITTNDTEAYSWFADCLNDKGTNPYTMDIYFVDSNGNRVEVTNDMTITVTIPDEYKTPIVCYTDTNGNSTVLESTVSGNAIIFKTNHNSYYSIVEKKTNSSNPTINNDGSSPQTSDNSNMILWVVLLFVSGGAVITWTVYTKRRKRQAR